MRHRRIGILVGILGMVVGAMAMFVGTIQATPGVEFRTRRARLCHPRPFSLRQHNFKIISEDFTDVVSGTLTIEVGGDTGWHTHPGPTFLTVAQGRVEVKILTSAGVCKTEVFSPDPDIGNTGFVEAGNEVHIATNVGSEQVVAYVTFLAVPPGGAILDPTPPAPTGRGC